jgi:hypothetical protein
MTKPLKWLGALFGQASANQPARPEPQLQYSAVPLASLTRQEIYERIWTWLDANASKRRKEGKEEPAPPKVITLAKALPLPGVATDADFDLAFTEVLRGHFEYFYSEKDKHGIALYEYANQGLSVYGEAAIHDERCNASLRTSAAYQFSFAYESEQYSRSRQTKL